MGGSRGTKSARGGRGPQRQVSVSGMEILRLWDLREYAPEPILRLNARQPRRTDRLAITFRAVKSTQTNSPPKPNRISEKYCARFAGNFRSQAHNQVVSDPELQTSHSASAGPKRPTSNEVLK